MKLLLFILLSLTSALCCPCSDPSLCQPITTIAKEELFAFQLLDGVWKNYAWNLVTTVAVFGTWDPQLMCTAHSKGVRVVTAANFDVSQLSNSTSRKEWIEQQIETVKTNYADGINIDIESPITDSTQKSFLTLLVKETQRAFQLEIPYAQLTVDVAWSPDCIDLRCYDYVGLSQHSDFLVVMDYDLRSQIRGPCVASANSPLELVVEGMYNYTKMGISPSKLVMGLPWYGYNYPCLDLTQNTCSIKHVPFRGVNCSDAAGVEYPFSQVQSLLKHNSTGRQWDDSLSSPFFNYFNSNTQMWNQIWYDDQQSLSIKVHFAKKMGLHGVSMWTADFLDYQGDPQESSKMWEALGSFFQ